MENNKQPKGPKNKPFNFYWIYSILFVVIIAMSFLDWNPMSQKITYSQLTELKNDSAITKIVVVNDARLEAYIKTDIAKKHEDIFKDTKGLEDKTEILVLVEGGKSFISELSEDKEAYGYKMDSRTETNYTRDIISWFLPIIILVAVWIFIMKRVSGGGAGGPGGQIFNIGKSKAQLFDKEKSVKVSFDDVAGLEGAKEELKEVVDFLKNPKKYTEIGAKIPKGALLVGPPGTGKTLMAKAVAGEAKVPFFSLSGSDFVEMFVGVGASRVRDLFKQAKEKSPAIIFIDEIDAIGRARSRGNSMGSNDERENTLNQLLTEMDGFGTNSGVIILAATNRADILDKALLRAGRFDRQIYVDMPDVVERKSIFNVHLKPLKLAEELDIDFLARQTPGFSGADIANVCNEAALIAARKGKVNVNKQDFLDAVDRIIGGLEKKHKIITDEEKKVIAYHEAGHATVSWLMPFASPLVKVTIVPRGQSLGAAWYLPEERSITTTNQLFHEMCATMGGRAAEKVIFNEISTGALSDLEKVNKQARAMVTIYGLNDKLGNISYYDSSGQNEYGFTKPYSEETAKSIDEEISKLIESSYAKAIEILSENKDKLTQLANLLMEKEVIFKEDLELIFGKRIGAKENALEVLGDAAAKTKAADEAKAEEVKAEEAKTAEVAAKEDQQDNNSKEEPAAE